VLRFSAYYTKKVVAARHRHLFWDNTRLARNEMKRLIVAVLALACAFAAVADGKSERRSDSRIWLPLGVLNFSDSGGAIVFPIFNLGF